MIMLKDANVSLFLLLVYTFEKTEMEKRKKTDRPRRQGHTLAGNRTDFLATRPAVCGSSNLHTLEAAGPERADSRDERGRRLQINVRRTRLALARSIE